MNHRSPPHRRVGLAHLPAAAEHVKTDLGRPLRIAIGGKCLDAVRIRERMPEGWPNLAHLSFPTQRHRARVEADGVTVVTPAIVAVQLFADGTLSPVGIGGADIKVGTTNLGPCVLEVVEADHENLDNSLIILRFRRVRIAVGGSRPPRSSRPSGT